MNYSYESKSSSLSQAIVTKSQRNLKISLMILGMSSLQIVNIRSLQAFGNPALMINVKQSVGRW